MANLPGEVCTRPPTCQGRCDDIKHVGSWLSDGVCVIGAIKRVAVKAGKTVAEKIGSDGMKNFIDGIPGASCGYLFDKAADYMYEHGDSFIECHPAPTGQPAPSGKP